MPISAPPVLDSSNNYENFPWLLPANQASNDLWRSSLAKQKAAQFFFGLPPPCLDTSEEARTWLTQKFLVLPRALLVLPQAHFCKNGKRCETTNIWFMFPSIHPILPSNLRWEVVSWSLFPPWYAAAGNMTMFIDFFWSWDSPKEVEGAWIDGSDKTSGIHSLCLRSIR